MLVLVRTKDGEGALKYSVLLENLRYSEAHRPRDDCHGKKGVTVPRRRGYVMPQDGGGHARKPQSPSGAEGKEGTVGRAFIAVLRCRVSRVRAG